MSSSEINFIYLNEPDMIKAGVTDMAGCIDVMEDVYELLNKGDYRMGGINDNSHGVVVSFPEKSEHAHMPLNGPDRRLCAMPAYLGGKHKVAGCKWYGSNLDNIDKGYPRSILTMTLNDVDTGAPLALMSANLLSAWRTGAIPGVGVRYLAKPDAKVVSLLGAGAIGTSSSEALLLEAKNAEVVKIYDIIIERSLNLKKKIEAQFPHVKVELPNNLEEAVRGSDIINLATSGTANPYLKKEWLEPGALITASSSGSFDPDYAIENIKLVVDNWEMYEAVKYEDNYPYNNLEMGVIGRLFLDWIHEGRMSEDKITNIGDIINGKEPARDYEDQIVVLALGGQPVYDVAWGNTVYQNALKKNIGTKLNLWKTPFQTL